MIIIIIMTTKPNANPNWYVYILQSVPKPSLTYVGMTNCPRQRLRRHNGELVQGAQYTSRQNTRPWKFVVRYRLPDTLPYADAKCSAARIERWAKAKYWSKSFGGNGRRRSAAWTDRKKPDPDPKLTECLLRFAESHEHIPKGPIGDPLPRRLWLLHRSIQLERWRKGTPTGTLEILDESERVMSTWARFDDAWTKRNEHADQDLCRLEDVHDDDLKTDDEDAEDDCDEEEAEGEEEESVVEDKS